MAITFVNAGAEGSAASGNITLGVPSSPQVGDIWIAVVHSSDQVAHTLTGWTQIAQGNGGGTTSRISVWWFRYNGSNPNMVVGHTAGQSPIGGIMAFRGCASSGSPVDVTGTIATGTDASIEINAVTTTVANTMLVACDGSADDNARSTVPSGFSVGFEDVAASVQNCYITTAGNPDGSVAGFYKTQAGVGSSGAFTDTQAAADPWASVLFALKPETSQTILPTAIPSSEALGNQGVRLTAAPAGLASNEAIGGPSLVISAAPTGIVSSEAFGNPSLQIVVGPIGIGSSETIGSAGIQVTASPASIALSESLGSPLLQLSVTANGIPSEEAMGEPDATTAVGDQTITAVSIISEEGIGSPTSVIFIVAESISASEAIGSPQIIATLSPTGIGSSEASGSPSVLALLDVAGIPSGEAMGEASIAAIVSPEGIPSSESVGSPNIGGGFASFGSAFIFEAAIWIGSTVCLEVHFKSNGGVVRARLWNNTDSIVVPNSEISTSVTSYRKYRSAVLIMEDGKQYVAQFGGGSGQFKYAKIIVTRLVRP